MNVQIKKLEIGDVDQFTQLIQVFERVFEMKDLRIPPPEYRRKLLANNDFIVLVAVVDNNVVGGLTTYVLHQYYSEKPLAYIYDLAVEAAIQRQGIGRTLIQAIKNHCSLLGFEEVFVQADRVDAYALDFYRKTGITAEEDVVHYYYKL